MIFTLIFPNKILFNKLSWWLVIELHSLVWTFEYEVERFKHQNALKKIYAWLKPYKVFNRHITSLLEESNYTKIGAVWSLLAEWWFHFSRWIIVTVLLTRNNLKYLIYSPFFYNSATFFFINIMRVGPFAMWSIYADRFVKVKHLNLIGRVANYFAANQKSWIHDEKFYSTTYYAVRFILLDVRITCEKWLRSTVFAHFKTIDFKKYTSFNSNKTSILIVWLLILLLFQYFFYYNILSHVWLFLIILFLLYILISTYFHFSKTYNINKYTSQTQRFWKRTFGAFWGLEFTLFFIYMFLTLISPAELPTYGANYKEIITGLNMNRNSDYHIIYLVALIFLNFSFACLIHFRKRDNLQYSYLFFLAINLCYCFIIYYEFLKFYYTAGWGAYSQKASLKAIQQVFEYDKIVYQAYNTEVGDKLHFKIPNSPTTAWNEVMFEKQWVRTFRHFIYILIILKFWHIFFIYFYFVLCLLKFLELDNVSFDVLSTNYQNAIYIVWFYLFSYLLIIKQQIYFTVAFIYYWSFVQVSYVDFVFYFSNEFYTMYIS